MHEMSINRASGRPLYRTVEFQSKQPASPSIAGTARVTVWHADQLHTVTVSVNTCEHATASRELGTTGRAYVLTEVRPEGHGAGLIGHLWTAPTAWRFRLGFGFPEYKRAFSAADGLGLFAELCVDRAASTDNVAELDIERPVLASEARSEVFDYALHIADWCMRLGKRQRLTEHPDGTRESVTTHTVMLSTVLLMLWEYDPTIRKRCDLGTLLAYSTVHDLPEADADDTPTLRPLTPEQRADKEDRERRAVEHLGSALPDIGHWSRSYEAQSDEESRLVRLVDKVLPKLTVILNGATVLHNEDIDPADLRSWHAKQLADFAAGLSGMAWSRSALMLLEDANFVSEHTFAQSSPPTTAECGP